MGALALQTRGSLEQDETLIPRPGLRAGLLLLPWRLSGWEALSAEWMLGSGAHGEAGALCFWEPLWYPVPRSCSVCISWHRRPMCNSKQVVSVSHQQSATVSGSVLWLSAGYGWVPAWLTGVGKQASSDCCLGVAVLTHRFLYRESLLIQEERTGEQPWVLWLRLSGNTSVTYKDGEWKHLSLGKNEAFSGEIVSSRV